MSSQQHHQCYANHHDDAACPLNSKLVHVATATTKMWMKKAYLFDFKRRLEHKTDEVQVKFQLLWAAHQQSLQG